MKHLCLILIYIDVTVLIFAHDLTNCKVDTITTSNRKVDTLDYSGSKMATCYCIDILLVLFSVLRFTLANSHILN